ncbi:hypothetical protein ACFLV4_06160 [Chloroflexota bacterium]
MKELTTGQKAKVIKCFFSGLTYDDIVQQLGIAKGSVVNIVDEFREGYLTVPPGMTEYLDELRKLVVDMKKNDTTVTQLTGYIKLHAKLKEMGVSSEQANEWLEICQGIATPTVPSNNFVKAALELAQLTSSNGLSYAELIDDYNAKLDASTKLGQDIGHKKDELSQIKTQFKEDQQQATEVLNSINKAITTAQDTLQKQKKDLDSQLNDYMAQNQISWEKVNSVTAIVNSELANKGFGKDDTVKISKDIAEAGSLLSYVKQMESERNELANEVSQLSEKEAELEASVGSLNRLNEGLTAALLGFTQKKQALNNEVEEREDRLAQLQDDIAGCTDVICITDFIMGTLLNPDSMTNQDIEQLTRFILYVRQHRLGIDREKVKVVDGQLACECKVPRWYFDPGNYEVDMEKVRRQLAICLAPIVQSDFMPRWEWEAEQYNTLIAKASDVRNLAQDVLALQQAYQKVIH